jgi:hypothetical protein
LSLAIYLSHRFFHTLDEGNKFGNPEFIEIRRMTPEIIERDFKDKVCEKLRLSSEGMNRYRVFTPFMFEDGDHLSIILKADNGQWLLSDEGHTYMHLTYDLEEKDLQRGTRQKIIGNALSIFGDRVRGENSSSLSVKTDTAMRYTVLSRHY